MSDFANYPPLPDELAQHPGYSRVFKPGHLTFGFIAPLESYPNSVGPTLADHAKMARKVDEAGFSAIWLRDVPFTIPTLAMSARCWILLPMRVIWRPSRVISPLVLRG